MKNKSQGSRKPSSSHDYDSESIEEIVKSAEQTGLSVEEIANRLGLARVELIKWRLDFRTSVRHHRNDDLLEPKQLDVQQERLEYLAEYCRTQGIFPIISKPTSVEPVEGRSNPFKEQMIISWKNFLKCELRHPTAKELINQLEKDATPLSGIVVDRKLRTIRINGHSREYGDSGKAYEQTYRRLKDQMLNQ